MRKPLNSEYLSDLVGPLGPDKEKPSSAQSPSEPKDGASFREYHKRPAPAPKRKQETVVAPKPDPAQEPAAPSNNGDRRRGSRTLRSS
jgi:hypothetical protein